MSVDPLRPVRIEPTVAVRRVHEREDDREQDPRRHSDESQERDEDAPPDDGLPHVDVRA